MFVKGKKDKIEIQDADKEESIFEVESIIDKKKVGTKLMYLVKWEGYSKEESTWEPVENLENVKEMLEQFEGKLISKEFKRIKNSTFVQNTNYNSFSLSEIF